MRGHCCWASAVGMADYKNQGELDCSDRNQGGVVTFWKSLPKPPLELPGQVPRQSAECTCVTPPVHHLAAESGGIETGEINPQRLTAYTAVHTVQADYDLFARPHSVNGAVELGHLEVILCA